MNSLLCFILKMTQLFGEWISPSYYSAHNASLNITPVGCKFDYLQF